MGIGPLFLVVQSVLEMVLIVVVCVYGLLSILLMYVVEIVPGSLDRLVKSIEPLIFVPTKSVGSKSEVAPKDIVKILKSGANVAELTLTSFRLYPLYLSYDGLSASFWVNCITFLGLEPSTKLFVI